MSVLLIGLISRSRVSRSGALQWVRSAVGEAENLHSNNDYLLPPICELQSSYNTTTPRAKSVNPVNSLVSCSYGLMFGLECS